MRYFVYNDPDWTYEDFDFDTLVRDSARVADTLNATDPDLSAFRELGGKLLVYSGWSDAAAPAAAVIGYYEDVLTHDETAAADVRLFMMPGVEHCFGGPGPSWVNYLDEIDRWVETGDAPEQVTAYWLNEQMQPDGSRPVCAYPEYVSCPTTGRATRDTPRASAASTSTSSVPRSALLNCGTTEHRRTEFLESGLFAEILLATLISPISGGLGSG
jgi:feruloyl esterase